MIEGKEGKVRTGDRGEGRGSKASQRKGIGMENIKKILRMRITLNDSLVFKIGWNSGRSARNKCRFQNRCKARSESRFILR